MPPTIDQAPAAEWGEMQNARGQGRGRNRGRDGGGGGGVGGANTRTMEDALIDAKPALLDLVGVARDFHMEFAGGRWEPWMELKAPRMDKEEIRYWVLQKVRPPQRPSREHSYGRFRDTRTEWSLENEERIRFDPLAEWDVYLCCAVLLGDVIESGTGVMSHDEEVRGIVNRIFATRNLWAHQRPYHTSVYLIDSDVRSVRAFASKEKKRFAQLRVEMVKQREQYIAKRDAEERIRQQERAKWEAEEAIRRNERMKREAEERAAKERRAREEEAKRKAEEDARKRKEQEEWEKSSLFRATEWVKGWFISKPAASAKPFGTGVSQ